MTSEPTHRRDWWRTGLGFGRKAKAITPTYRSIKSVVDAEQSRLTQMAAALSYRTIFGMIPVLMVSLVAIKMFASEAQIESLITQVSKQLGLDRIAFNPGAPKPGGDATREQLLHGLPANDHAGPGSTEKNAGIAAPGSAPSEVKGGDEPKSGAAKEPPTPPDADPAKLASPESPAREPILAGEAVGLEPPVGTGSAGLDEWIKGMVKSISAIRFDAIGYVGLAMLIYAAISMMVEIEHCFNQIFRVPTGRSWTRRITHYWTLLTLGTLLLGLTFVVGEKFKQIMQTLANDSFIGSGRLSVLGIGYLTTIGISTLLFLFMYTVIPNTRVKLRPALVGALVAAILWETGKWGFAEYIRRSTGYQMLYGQIALLPLFLLWIYTAWLIVLSGLYITYQLQYVRQKTVAQPVDFGEPAIIDPSSIFSVIGGLTKQFQQGKSIEGAALAKSIGVYEPAVNQMLGRLAESGLVHRIRKNEQSPDEYALAMPPERINAEQVLGLGEELAGQNGESKDEFTASMRRTRMDAIKGKSVAAVLGLASGAEGSAARTEATPEMPSAATAPTGATAIAPQGTADSPDVAMNPPTHARGIDAIESIHASLNGAEADGVEIEGHTNGHAPTEAKPTKR